MSVVQPLKVFGGIILRFDGNIIFELFPNFEHDLNAPPTPDVNVVPSHKVPESKLIIELGNDIVDRFAELLKAYV